MGRRRRGQPTAEPAAVGPRGRDGAQRRLPDRGSARCRAPCAGGRPGRTSPRPRCAPRAARTPPAVQLRLAAVSDTALAQPAAAVVDLVDRLIGGGVVIAGDITLSVADISLGCVTPRPQLARVGTLE